MKTVQLFPLSDVRLLDGPFKHARDVLHQYLLTHDVDRLLAPYRFEAGLELKAPKYPNWESTGLDGHTAGHYLTALAQMVAGTGDAEMRRRLDYMVNELADVQRANGDGYVGGVPGGKQIWAAVAEGRINVQGFSLGGAWVPWYNVHKIFAGLRDAWFIAHNPQACDVFINLCNWCERLTEKLSNEQMQEMLRSEHGGMNKVIADAFAITGDAKYLALARRFSHRATLDPLLHQQDTLTGLHANTQIPKVIGFERIAMLAGDHAWEEAARFFWETVVHRRSTVIGGNSVQEHFNPPEDFSTMLESRAGPETCNTYNMLQLTEQLFERNPAAHYADYYERALYNHILSSQHPEHGGLVYFTAMRPRDYRVYSAAGTCFWCCVGTGMENHGKYGSFIYAHNDTALFVNLFIASELDWKARGVKLRQETNFPDEPRTRLTLCMAGPQRFNVHVRYPAWVKGGDLTIRINGKAEPISDGPSSYVNLVREWRDGDRIEVDLPMHIRIERLADDSDYVAFLHGPIVLAARTGTEDLAGLIAGDGRMAHVGGGALLPADEAPMLVGDPATLAEQLQPVPGQSLRFNARSLIQPDRYRELELQPFFRLHDARYVIYWRTTTAAQYPKVVQQLETKERHRLALEARTLDQVTPGQQQPEVEHRFQGQDTNTGTEYGRSWRDARGWFSYDLHAPDDRATQLIVTYWAFLWSARRFDIFVNDQLLAEVTLAANQQEQFVEQTYDLPAEVIAPEGLWRVKFVARENSTAGPIYGVRLVKPEHDTSHRRRQPMSECLDAPTLVDVAYGDHPRQVLDFWQARSDKPAPVVFHIHGGGWVRGDKSTLKNVKSFLDKGISVVNINYRFTWQAQQAGVRPPVAWPMHDAKRALQFVRSKAAEWNIDKQRIGAWGGSAGACSGLWLALHNDMADPNSADLIARESTRLWCAAVDAAQTTLDPLQMQQWTPNSTYGGHAFGFCEPDHLEARDARFHDFLQSRETVLPWIKEYSPIEHASSDDPPIYLAYGNSPALGQPQKDPTHTANFGVKLKEKLASLGVECELVFPGAKDVKHASSAAFLVALLAPSL